MGARAISCTQMAALAISFCPRESHVWLIGGVDVARPIAVGYEGAAFITCARHILSMCDIGAALQEAVLLYGRLQHLC